MSAVPPERPAGAGSGAHEADRGATRAALKVPVELQFVGSSSFATGFTANLSAAGMFVESESPQPIGTLVRFQLRLGEGQPLIEGMAEVVWIRVRRKSKEEPAGMGFSYRFLEGDGGEALERAVRDAALRQASETPAIADREATWAKLSTEPRSREVAGWLPPIDAPVKPKRPSYREPRPRERPQSKKASGVRDAKREPRRAGKKGASERDPELRKKLIILGALWIVLLLVVWRVLL